MANYVYKCGRCTMTKGVSHPMSDDPLILCPVCNQSMYRVPQTFMVNWDGPSPSQWEMDPALKEHINNPNRGRDIYEAMHNE